MSFIFCIDVESDNNLTDDDYDKELNHTDDDYSGVGQHSNKTTFPSTTVRVLEKTTVATTTQAYFSEMPVGIKISYINATTLLQFDNKGEKMMGVSNEKCDNAKVRTNFPEWNSCFDYFIEKLKKVSLSTLLRLKFVLFP